MQSFQGLFLCLPLADVRWLPIGPDWPEPTSDPKEKVGEATWSSTRWERGRVGPGFRVAERQRSTMWGGGCLYNPQVELVSLLSAFRRPWRQAGPLAVLGIWNARKAKGNRRLVGRQAGQEQKT